ncbi:MAG: hypothetical protein IPK48_07760 [Gammaproteobacteria bacterium]|nr:hypothetical protein [Gammaproteobacteria bacterium]
MTDVIEVSTGGIEIVEVGLGGVVVNYNDIIGLPALGTAAAQDVGDFEAAGAVATHAAITSAVHGISVFGATLVDDADASTARGTLGLGTASTTDSTSYATAAQGVTNGDSHDHSGGDGAQISYSGLSGLPTLGTAAATAITDYAPAAQGVTNGDSHDHNGGDGAQIAYSSLSGLPSLGSAAATASTDYATAAQGGLADSAMQPGDDAAGLGSGAAPDGYVATADGVGGVAWEAVPDAYSGAASEIHAATSKTTPVDADELGLIDSAASYVLKKLTWANLKTTLSSVFAVLAGKSGGQTIVGGTGTTDSLVLQSTSGVGATGAQIRLNVGNNGATNAITVLNDGKVGIGITSPVTALDVSGIISIGEQGLYTTHKRLEYLLALSSLEMEGRVFRIRREVKDTTIPESVLER